MPKPFKLAMIQMLVNGGDLAGNLARAEDRLAAAAAQGAQVALLPECMDLGWTHPASQQGAAPVPDGDTCAHLAATARKNNIDICAGITERDGERVYNTAVYIDAQGHCLGKHRKLNELGIGHPFYAQGDRLNVVETEYGTIGLMICADAFARDHVLTRSLGYLGADVILSPCAWAVPADHDNLKHPYGGLWRKSYCPVAIMFSVWIAGVSNVGRISAGPWEGQNCIGCSMLVDPEANVVVNGPYGTDADTILYADITPIPRPARGGSWESYFDRTH